MAMDRGILKEDHRQIARYIVETCGGERYDKCYSSLTSQVLAYSYTVFMLHKSENFSYPACLIKDKERLEIVTIKGKENKPNIFGMIIIKPVVIHHILKLFITTHLHISFLNLNSNSFHLCNSISKMM